MESAVKGAKKILLKCKKTGSDAFLAPLDHRNTLPTGIQISPAQRLLNISKRSLLPMSAGLLKLMKIQPTRSFACINNSKQVTIIEAPLT